MNSLTQYGIWIVLGIGVVLLFRRWGRSGGTGRAQHEHGGYGSGHTAQSPPSMTGTTATDPVTGKVVSLAHATTSVYHGRVYYFETPENRQRFEASPEQYAAAQAGQPLSADKATERTHSGRGGCC